MLIFSRWGILILGFFGISALIGFGCAHVISPGREDGPAYYLCLGIGLLVGGMLLRLFSQHVLDRYLDKAQPQYAWQPLPQPFVDPQGRTVTHQPLPLVDPQTGAHLHYRPRSTLFFIPARIWAVLMMVVGVLILLVNLFRLLIG